MNWSLFCIVAFADGAKVEFLAYNTVAGAKYPMLGRTYPMDGIAIYKGLNQRNDKIVQAAELPCPAP